MFAQLQLVLFVAYLAVACRGDATDRVCVRKFCVPHRGITHTHIDVTVWKMCGDRDVQPAAIISTGSLVLAEEYDGVATAIANRHLTVFAADYTARVPEIPVFRQVNRIVRRQCRGCRCPRNGHHVAVSSLRTLARFAGSYADTRNALVFGHSSGATVVAYDLFKQCDANVIGKDMMRHFCDGATDSDVRFYRPAVVALFDGLTPIRNLAPLKGALVFNMLSQYASPTFTGNATQLLKGGAVDVWFDPNVNHFGPNDFNSAFGHAKTKCAFLKGKGMEFRSTEVIQTQVVMAIADVVTQAYFKFVAAGDITIPSIAMGVRNTRYVQHVQYKI